MLTAVASIKLVNADLRAKKLELERVIKKLNEVGPLGEEYNRLAHTLEMKVSSI